jgi:HSP90 family molecular chaperone
MCARFEKNEHDAVLSVCAELLFGYALLVEGAELPDPSRFNRLLAGCILHAL